MEPMNCSDENAVGLKFTSSVPFANEISASTNQLHNEKTLVSELNQSVYISRQHM